MQEQPYKIGFLLVSLLIAGVLLVACGPLPPTATTAPMATPLPTLTHLLLPTASATSTTAGGREPEARTPTDTVHGALACVRDGDLWLHPLSGGPATRLTDFGDVTDPRFSPDGRLILFQRQGETVPIPGVESGAFQRLAWWVLPLVDGGPYQVLDRADLPGHVWGETITMTVPVVPNAWTWLPDGHSVLFTTKDVVYGVAPNDDLWRLDLEDGQRTQLLSGGQGGRPALSTDGQAILLSTATQVAIARADGTDRRTLLTFEPVPTYSKVPWIPHPQWIEDGTARVAIPASWAWGEPFTATLWLLRPATGEAEPLGEIQLDEFQEPLWSPDGSRLAYGAGDLVLADGDGRNPRRLTMAGNVLPLAWSPAGHWLAVNWAGQLCAVEDTDAAAPACLHQTLERRVFWQDEQHLAFLRTTPWEPPSLVQAQLPNVIRSSSLEGALLESYDLYLPPSPSSLLIQPTATAIPTSIQEWLEYRNPALGLAVKYPHDWSVVGPADQFGPWIESWPVVTFASDLYGYGEQAFGKYAVAVAVGESRGATVTETVEYSLSPVGPEVRATIERRCCLTVGGEPAIELLLSGVMSRWGTRLIVVLHAGREYWLSFAPQGPARDGTTPSDELARAAFDTFLRTFTFIPLSAAPPPTPTITPVPTPTEAGLSPDGCPQQTSRPCCHAGLYALCGHCQEVTPVMVLYLPVCACCARVHT